MGPEQVRQLLRWILCPEQARQLLRLILCRVESKSTWGQNTILMTRLRSHLKVSDLFIEIEKDKEPWSARIFRMAHRLRELDE